MQELVVKLQRKRSAKKDTRLSRANSTHLYTQINDDVIDIHLRNLQRFNIHSFRQSKTKCSEADKKFSFAALLYQLKIT